MKRKFLPNVAIPLLLPFLVLAAYIVGYLSLHHHLVGAVHDPKYLIRVYPHKWQADLFQPAARIESLLKGGDVIAEQLSELSADDLSP